MRTISQDFKDQIIVAGKINDLILMYDTEILKPNKAKYSFSGNVFSTSLSQLDIELNGQYDLIDKQIDLKFGLKIDSNEYEEFEYIDWEDYYVYKLEYDKDRNLTKLTAYDRMIEFMVKYDLESTATNMLDYVKEICERIDIELYTEDFNNFDMPISEDYFFEQDITFRDVLDRIAEATLTNIFIKDGKLYLKNVRTGLDSPEVITNSYIKKGTVTSRWGDINSLVLGRTPQVGDDAYMQDTDDIAINGIKELRIDNNDFLNLIREDIIGSMFSLVNKLGYYPTKTDTLGLGYIEFGDWLTVPDVGGDNNYITLVTSYEFDITTGTKDTIISNVPLITKTKYEYASSTDKRLSRTEIIVNKQDATIQQIIVNQNETNTEMSEVLQTVDDLTVSIQKSGGINLLKNSSGQNNTNYWGVAVGNIYIESDTPPVDVYDTMLWYCTKTEGDYTEGILYMYDAYLEEWEDSGLTREQATEVFGTINGVEVINSNNYDNDELREEYKAGSAFRLSVTDFYPEIAPSEMIANMICEPIDITEDTYNLSFKIKNNLTSGIARIGINQYGEYLQNVENYSRYFLHSTKKMITPDENNGEYYTYNIQISKANIDNLLFGTISSTEPSTPEDNSYWLDTTDYETTFTAVLKQYDTTNEIWEEVDLSLLTEFENGTIYETNSIEFGDINTKEMWTYTSGSFLPCETTTDKYNAKQMVVTLVIFPELYMIVESDTEPEPSFGLYWVDTVNELIKRAKYVLTGEEYVFDSWITLDETYLFYSEILAISAGGNIIIGDLMLVGGNQEKDWTPAVDEVYGKRVKIDSSGLTVSTYENDNTMNITESEIVARKGDEKVFEISGYQTILKDTEIQEQLLMGKIITIIQDNGTDEYYID